jgi:chromosome segregation protein
MEIEKLTRSKGKEISSYLEKIHNFDILLSQRETKLENISDIIFDRYNINRNDFKNKIWIESFDEEKIEELKNKEISELKEEVKKLEAKIKSLGPVNINAIEEFKEVTERYDFLTSQKVDLEDATKDLNNVIQKINEKAKEKFLDTFEKVNENFKEIIKRLFNGGEAELSLIDPNDILETGIEINVRPPGKKIRNIMLLSGGEKAMAAVGLLFALFKVKPSPFCILDEIDAPLDDANIGRFLKLLKEFALNTQFVIVTHHKKTMAACDLLYGVTMEDKGISKILSVKLSDSKKIDELAG